MAVSGGGNSAAGTNVLFREVHKNAWLRRLPVTDRKTGGAHPKKGERVWTVFCVHDDIEPFLELYNEQKVAVAHKPDWSVSLSNTLHISPTICPQDDEFEFVITLPDNVVRLTAASWEVMMEWVDSIGAKLREMRILSPRENVYSRMPEMRAPLLPTRDPNSPLPLPPVGPLTVVPGVEPLSVSDAQDAPSTEHSNERHSSSSNSHVNHHHHHQRHNSHHVTASQPNNISVPVPVSTASSSVYIAQTENVPAVYASTSSSSTSQAAPSSGTPQQNVTVIQVKSDAFDFNSVIETLPEEVIVRNTTDSDNNKVVLVNEENRDDVNEDDDDEEEEDEDVFTPSLTVTPLLPRIPNHIPKTNSNATANQSSSASHHHHHQRNNNVEDVHIVPNAVRPAKPIVKRHQSAASNSNIRTEQINASNNRDRGNNSVPVESSNTNVIDQTCPSSSGSSSNNRLPSNDNNLASSSNSSSSGSGSGSGSSVSASNTGSNNINLYEHVFLSTNQQQQQQQRVPPTSPVPVAQDILNSTDIHLLQDHNTPPPAPVVSSGRSRSGTRQTRRRSSDSSMNAGGAPVAADRIRRLQPPPHPFRQNGSLADCDTVSARLTLREQQVLQLRREMTHPGGVRLQLRRRDCLNSIALVDAFAAVWVGGWKQKDHPMLYNALHIGDQIISVAGVRVVNSGDAQKLIRGAPSLYVAFVIRRVPFGRVFALKRESEGQSLGLVQEGGTAELRDVVAGSLASAHGLPPRTPSIDGLSLTTWTLTEINGRPLNLFFKENEVKDRLNAVGLDISLLVQPSDLIKQIKKQLKSLRSYKDYIVQ